MAIALQTVSSGYNLSAINDNFISLQNALNNSILWRAGFVAGETLMQRDIDMNGFTLLNLGTNLEEDGSLITVGQADARYYNVTGDTLTGPMEVNGNVITGLVAPVDVSSPVRLQDLNDEALARTEADMSLQEQINGTNPPMGSAFSIISWHDQAITNSMTIPDNKNAWSFGPQLTISPGQTVAIGSGSFWTIANGETAGTGTLVVEIPNPLDMGTL